MFIEPKEFCFVERLVAAWPAMRAELNELSPALFQPWKETHLYGTGWDVFPLYGFGKKLAENCHRVPVTSRIVETIPGLVTAAFSALQPGTHIKPHVGYHYELDEDGQLVRQGLNSQILRLHLGLLVPPTYTELGCAIRVRGQVSAWHEGACLVFDDTLEHEAWNRSQGTRVVLLIDFRPPPDWHG